MTLLTEETARHITNVTCEAVIPAIVDEVAANFVHWKIKHPDKDTSKDEVLIAQAVWQLLTALETLNHAAEELESIDLNLDGNEVDDNDS